MIYHELSVWTRGIIMDKEARDIANCIANTAANSGFHSQMISDYVDDPDRTNCLVRKYARFSDEPIEFKFIYENPHPNWVVLVEETLVKAVNFFRGTSDGAATRVTAAPRSRSASSAASNTETTASSAPSRNQVSHTAMRRPRMSPSNAAS